MFQLTQDQIQAMIILLASSTSYLDIMDEARVPSGGDYDKGRDQIVKATETIRTLLDNLPQKGFLDFIVGIEDGEWFHVVSEQKYQSLKAYAELHDINIMDYRASRHGERLFAPANDTYNGSTLLHFLALHHPELVKDEPGVIQTSLDDVLSGEEIQDRIRNSQVLSQGVLHAKRQSLEKDFGGDPKVLEKDLAGDTMDVLKMLEIVKACVDEYLRHIPREDLPHAFYSSKHLDLPQDEIRSIQRNSVLMHEIARLQQCVETGVEGRPLEFKIPLSHQQWLFILKVYQATTGREKSAVEAVQSFTEQSSKEALSKRHHPCDDFVQPVGLIAISGPRRCGKSVIAGVIAKTLKEELGIEIQPNVAFPPEIVQYATPEDEAKIKKACSELKTRWVLSEIGTTREPNAVPSSITLSHKVISDEEPANQSTHRISSTMLSMKHEGLSVLQQLERLLQRGDPGIKPHVRGRLNAVIQEVKRVKQCIQEGATGAAFVIKRNDGTFLEGDYPTHEEWLDMLERLLTFELESLTKSK